MPRRVVGHLRRAACQRLAAAIWAEHPWLASYLLLDRRTLKLRRRDLSPCQARTVLAQYRHWQRAYPNDLLLIQVGAFFEQLQWPQRQKAKGTGAATAQDSVGLKRMQPTRRGALQGFPLHQLPRRLPRLLAARGSVTVLRQVATPGSGLLQRLAHRRWRVAAVS